MVRAGDWKLWVYADEEGLPPALFNLADDPGETHDLGRGSEHRETRERLLRRVYDGWDPGAVRASAAAAAADHAVITAWSRQTRPVGADTLAVPPPELESEVELL